MIIGQMTALQDIIRKSAPWRQVRAVRTLPHGGLTPARPAPGRRPRGAVNGLSGKGFLPRGGGSTAALGPGNALTPGAGSGDHPGSMSRAGEGAIGPGGRNCPAPAAYPRESLACRSEARLRAPLPLLATSGPSPSRPSRRSPSRPAWIRGDGLRSWPALGGVPCRADQGRSGQIKVVHQRRLRPATGWRSDTR